MKKEVLLIGKIIKQKAHGKRIYETVLMSKSKIQFNDFTEDQCRKMLQCNLSFKKNTSVNGDRKYNINNLDVKQEDNTSVKIYDKFSENDTDRMMDNIEEVMEDLFSDEKMKSSKRSNVLKLSTEKNDDNVVIVEEKKKDIRTKTKSRAPKRTEIRKEGNQVNADDLDFLLNKEVAFDFQNDEFKSRFEKEMKKVNLPEKTLINGRFITGYVFERFAKKAKGASHPMYKIGFQYTGDGMKEMIFKTEDIFNAIQLQKEISSQTKNPLTDVPNLDLIKLEDPEMKSIYQFNPDDVDGDVIESEDDEDENVMDQTVNRLEERNSFFQKQFYGAGEKSEFNTDLFMEYPLDTNTNELENNQGLIWEKNALLNRPSGIRLARPSHLRDGCHKKFRSEIESVLAFLPMGFWLYHLKQTNNYLKGSLEEKSSGTDSSSSIFREISIDELMIFYAIIIQMAMKPHPGSPYTVCWRNDYKVWYTACNHMSRNRFQEIRGALHWCDNRFKNLCVNRQTKKQDTLYKIRPLLSIIEKNLGRYLEPCTELSLDETCVAIRSQWARAVTFYNPKKPKGKHHLKFYTLCENSHWCALQIKLCHRFKKDNFEVKESNHDSNTKGDKEKSTTDIFSQNSFNENEVIGSDVEDADNYDDTSDDESITALENKFEEDFFNEVDEIMDEEIPNSSVDDIVKSKKEETQCEKVTQKTVQTVTNLCKKYRGSGRVINMDNLYSSPLVFIKLKEMSLYARGTVRLNRKYLPRFIKYLRKDMRKLPRGSYQFAVNNEYNMSMHCWHDNNPVHVLSTADSTAIEEVSRKQGSNKIIVQCPSTVKNYNKNMQAVDQFNKLMSLFSLSEAHTFTKYYKKIAMVLMDFVFVNLYLHHKIFADSSPSIDNKKRKRLTRKKYMENLIDALIETDWAKVARDYEQKSEEKAGKNKRKYGYMNDEEDNNDEDEEHIFNEVDFDLVPSLPPLPEEYICQAVSFDSKTSLFSAKNGSKNKSKFYCKVCQFEGRGNVRKGTVFCFNHGLSLCQQVNVHPKEKKHFILRNSKIDTTEITDWKWLSSRQEEWTCWQKAHYDYIPKGLFKLKDKSIHMDEFEKYSAFDFGSTPYLLRKVALNDTYYKKVGVRTEKKLVS